MPIPSRALTGVRLSRRAALAAAAVGAGGALAGCTPNDSARRRRQDEPEPAPQVDPDVAVATEALADQTAIISLLRATQERHVGLAEVLAPLLASHEEHAALLAEAVPEGTGPSVSPSPSGSAGPSESPSTTGSASADGSADLPTTVPRSQARALDRLVRAEEELTTATKRHAFKAQSGAFARVLGSMAAAAAQHAVVLASAPRQERRPS